MSKKNRAALVLALGVTGILTPLATTTASASEVTLPSAFTKDVTSTSEFASQIPTVHVLDAKTGKDVTVAKVTVTVETRETVDDEWTKLAPVTLSDSSFKSQADEAKEAKALEALTRGLAGTDVTDADSALVKVSYKVTGVSLAKDADSKTKPSNQVELAKTNTGWVETLEDGTEARYLPLEGDTTTGDVTFTVESKGKAEAKADKKAPAVAAPKSVKGSAPKAAAPKTELQALSAPKVAAAPSVVEASGITGTVFQDVNKNGSRDNADSKLVGYTVELRDDLNNNAIISTTKTDSRGQYAFENLGPGAYNVTVKLKSGEKLTRSWNDVNTPKAASVDITSGESFKNVDFGIANGTTAKTPSSDSSKSSPVTEAPKPTDDSFSASSVPSTKDSSDSSSSSSSSSDPYTGTSSSSDGSSSDNSSMTGTTIDSGALEASKPSNTVLAGGVGFLLAGLAFMGRGARKAARVKA